VYFGELPLQAAKVNTKGTQIRVRLMNFRMWLVRRVLTVETVLQSMKVIGDNHGKRLLGPVHCKWGKPVFDGGR